MYDFAKNKLEPTFMQQWQAMNQEKIAILRDGDQAFSRNGMVL